MPAPRNYVRGYSFAGYQATNPNRPLPGTSLDNELEEIEQSLTEAISALSDIRRADGQLRNGIVGLDALAPDLATGVRPATLWQAGIQYQAQDTVSYLASFYRCTIGHLSTDFLTDLTATRWELYAELGSIATDAQIARNEAVAAAAAAVPAGAAATAGSNNVTALYDLFDDRYLGEKSTLPTLDNDGNALVNGALVSLTGQTPTTLNGMYVRRGGAWQSVLSQFLGAFVPYRYVATASQTVFSGADANGATLGYVANAVLVTVNGVSLSPNTYTATNGTSVVLGTALTAGDVVVIYSFGSFSVADTWTKAEAVTVTGPQSFTDAQKLQARVNIGTASTKNLPGATIWDKIVFAANNGYRWADVEDYDGQTISVTSRLDMGSEFQLFAGGALFDKAFNGTMFRLGDKAQIHGGKYDPKPGSFTGDLFDVLTGNNQIIRNIIMRDKAEGYGLNFKASDEGGSDGAGSGMLVDGGLWIGATTGSTKAHAFKGPNIAPATSGYARFTSISCGGTQAFDLRASRGWQITEPLIGGDNPLLFANNSFNTQIRGGRVALTGIQNVFGTNHVFDKVEIGGPFTYTLGANAAGCVFNLIGYEDIVDNSTKINRFFGCKEHSFTPTFTVSAGGPVNFGTGGSIVGFARRIDDRLRLNIVITWGTSATFGTGTYTIGLPSTFSLSSVLSRRATVGGRAIYIRGTSERQGMHCDIAASASTFVVYVDDEAANFFGYAWPFTTAANDRQVIEFEYEVGVP